MLKIPALNHLFTSIASPPPLANNTAQNKVYALHTEPATLRSTRYVAQAGCKGGVIAPDKTKIAEKQKKS